MSMWTRVTGDGLRSPTNEVHALDRVLQLERPSYVRVAWPRTGLGPPRLPA